MVITFRASWLLHFEPRVITFCGRYYILSRCLLHFAPILHFAPLLHFAAVQECLHLLILTLGIFFIWRQCEFGFGELSQCSTLLDCSLMLLLAHFAISQLRWSAASLSRSEHGPLRSFRTVGCFRYGWLHNASTGRSLLLSVCIFPGVVFHGCTRSTQFALCIRVHILLYTWWCTRRCCLGILQVFDPSILNSFLRPDILSSWMDRFVGVISRFSFRSSRSLLFSCPWLSIHLAFFF